MKPLSIALRQEALQVFGQIPSLLVFPFAQVHVDERDEWIVCDVIVAFRPQEKFPKGNILCEPHVHFRFSVSNSATGLPWNLGASSSIRAYRLNSSRSLHAKTSLSKLKSEIKKLHQIYQSK